MQYSAASAKTEDAVVDGLTPIWPMLSRAKYNR